MSKALVACRAGMGSSLMLKIKVQEVVNEKGWDLELEHSSLDGVTGFNGDIIITLSDVAQELEARNLQQTVIGINNIVDKKEIQEKLEPIINE